jgi:hypothetical protein
MFLPWRNKLWRPVPRIYGTVLWAFEAQNNDGCRSDSGSEYDGFKWAEIGGFDIVL